MLYGEQQREKHALNGSKKDPVTLGVASTWLVGLRELQTAMNVIKIRIPPSKLGLEDALFSYNAISEVIMKHVISITGNI